MLGVRFGDDRGVTRSVDFDDDVNSAGTGIRDDVCDVLGGVCGLGRVGAFFRENFISRDYEGETLAVDDVPVEGVDLLEAFNWGVNELRCVRTLTQLMASS